MRTLAAIVTGAAAAALAGCALPITLPYRRITAEPTAAPPTTVVVAITSTEFNKGQRPQFFGRTREVMRDMPNHEGLLGYTVRFQVFGTRAWTMSVWRDQASMERFVSARVHRRAMSDGDKLLKAVRSRTVTIPAEQAPLKWSEAVRLVDGPGWPP